jgi:hypothetical protein
VLSHKVFVAGVAGLDLDTIGNSKLGLWDSMTENKLDHCVGCSLGGFVYGTVQEVEQKMFQFLQI